MASQNSHVKLSYDNAVKLETRSNGVFINGDLDLDDNDIVRLGTGNDLQIYHNGTNSFIDNSGGSLSLRNNVSGGSGSIQIQAKATEYSINAFGNGGVHLYYDDSKKFETTSSGVTVTGSITPTGNITFADSSAGGNNRLLFGGGAIPRQLHMPNL